jgi:hypothetical protein
MQLLESKKQSPHISSGFNISPDNWIVEDNWFEGKELKINYFI